MDIIMKNSQQRRRVVVTGIGLVTPLGLDVPSTWAAARAGKVGIGPLTKVDIPTINVRVAKFAVGCRRITSRRARRGGWIW